VNWKVPLSVRVLSDVALEIVLEVVLLEQTWVRVLV